ncbi:hypothetical protein ScalyP_jg7772 [Parmales sp. scaly parma]|nr:hypothetical protein ScalyP_jg7772 [Parmales sp. scaly parma]
MMSLEDPHEFGVVAQSVALQVSSILALEGAQAFSLRASDTTRFASLMLVVYLQVDLVQTFLYLRVDSKHFQELRIWRRDQVLGWFPQDATVPR